MKLTIERSELLSTLSHAQSIVERRNTIPILGNVLMKAVDGRLELSATDMAIGVSEPADVSDLSDGSATAPAHTLYEIASKLPDGAQVELETLPDTGQIRVRSGKSTFMLAALPTEEFPVITGGEFDIEFSVPAGSLRRLIDRTVFAVSTVETRLYLNGIYLHAAGEEDAPVLRAVATDGHRLARAEVGLPEGASGMPGVIVPRKAVNELAKLLQGSNPETPVPVSLSEVKIRFVVDEVELTSKLIDGTFPNYERVIPAGNDKTVRGDKVELKAAVDRVATVCEDRERAVRLALDGRSMVISATGPDKNSAEEEVGVSYESEKLDIGFNVRYLTDILGQIEGETVAIDLADASSPALIRDEADASALYVLMPMRV